MDHVNNYAIDFADERAIPDALAIIPETASTVLVVGAVWTQVLGLSPTATSAQRDGMRFLRLSEDLSALPAPSPDSVVIVVPESSGDCLDTLVRDHKIDPDAVKSVLTVYGL